MLRAKIPTGDIIELICNSAIKMGPAQVFRIKVKEKIILFLQERVSNEQSLLFRFIMFGFPTKRTFYFNKAGKEK